MEAPTTNLVVSLSVLEAPLSLLSSLELPHAARTNTNVNAISQDHNFFMCYSPYLLSILFVIKSPINWMIKTMINIITVETSVTSPLPLWNPCK